MNLNLDFLVVKDIFKYHILKEDERILNTIDGKNVA